MPCGKVAIILALAAAGCRGEIQLGQPAPRHLAAPDARTLVFAAPPSWLPQAKETLREAGIQIRAGGSIRPGKALLVDEKGIARRLGQAPDSAERAVAFVRDWEQGGLVFRNRCARCHGDDGQDTSYPYIKPLGSLGNRLSLAEIRQRLHPTVVGPEYVTVRGESMTTADLDMLIVFIAGL